MGVRVADKAAGRGKDKGKGAIDASATDCPTCGADNQPGSRFCRQCGRSLSRNGMDWFSAQTMTVLGAACLTLVVLGLLFSSVINLQQAGQDVAVTSRTTSTSSGQPPDLSTMTPREAADRLFNRVMMADEQGDDDEVAQFAPMAMAAYDRLDELDLDGIYHVGLIKAAAGDASGAEEIVERLRRVVPEHLLASLLDYRLATDADDRDRADRAAEQFRAHYESEIQIDRPEYQDHQRQIDLFRQQIGLNGG